MRSATLLESVSQEADEKAKALGAYYTDAPVADFLVWWAVRSPQDTVMDPSFGGGVFLTSACERVRRLGGQPADRVFGVEIDDRVHAQTAKRVGLDFGVPRRHLLHGDFFDVRREALPPLHAVVGNPPFIRYQRFSGDARAKGLACALREGVHLNNLSSSWAPFVVHSIAMLSDGGRLAMVLPVEVGQAAYAIPVLACLEKSFGRVTFLTFRKKLFPELSEETLLVLADRKGAGPAEFFWRDLADAGGLAAVQGHDTYVLSPRRRMDSTALAEGRERLTECFVPRKALDLYRRLTGVSGVRRLGAVADVGIGYVTGANDFFHLDARTAARWRIPIGFLKPAVRRSRAFRGLRFTTMDWRQASEIGDAGYLLYVEPEPRLPKSVQAYLAHGERQGVSQGFKCRSRSPWFRVPHVYLPDAFLSYMSGVMPRLVANDAEAFAPNTLHIVRLRPEDDLTAGELAASWRTSLTQLSAEIEGHALGGGMLKLEPKEAQNVLVACRTKANGQLAQLAEELDSLIRGGHDLEAHARADAVILKAGLGLSERECRILRMAADQLRNRRYARSGTS